MTAVHEWLGNELAWVWAGVADHLWQSTVFAFLILVASLLLKRGRARMRHSLWLVAAAKFIVPAALCVFLVERAGIDPAWLFQPLSGTPMNLLQGLNGPASAIANSYEFTVFAGDAISHNEIYCAVSLIWLTGFLAFLVIWARQRRKFFRALKQGQSVSQGREWNALERSKKALRVNAPVGLVISTQNTEPAVCGIWKPVVLLPQAIADHLDEAELEAIMLHELIHIQRRDNLIGSLQMIVCSLLWFHPLVWFINSKLLDERELACDEEVLKIRVAPEAYASSILKVVRFSLGWRVAGVTGAGSGSNLRRRIENIMSANNSTRGAAWYRWLAGTMVSFALVLMVVAGLYTRARNVNAAAQEMSSGSNAARVDSMNPASTADEQGPQDNKAQLPPSPPQAPNGPQAPNTPQAPNAPDPPKQLTAVPPAPAAPQDHATAPAAPAVPTAAPMPSAPTAPAAVSPSTPPAPPVAPVPPTKEKIKSDKVKTKYKDKEKDDQDKVEKGGLIEAPPPVYPAEAKEKKVEGRVTVDIVIGDDGNVISAKPASGPDLLHGAARDAALKARFRPTLVNGKPAKVSGKMSYNFVLDK